MMDSQRTILPGQWIGVFGGGQLGRMFAMAAQQFGYRIRVYAPEPNCPAGHVANEVDSAPYDDLEAVARFARSVDVITLEFENIDLRAVEEAERHTIVRPGLKILEIAQHRWKEKSFLHAHGFPVTPHALVRDLEDVPEVGERLGWPMIWKTLQWGYDGKGQVRVTGSNEAAAAWSQLGQMPCIAEKQIALVAEFSILVARNAQGQVETYPMFVNEHRDHILDISYAPASAELSQVEEKAREIAYGVAEKLELVGLLCIEFFLDGHDELMINELAPRPHNSGHLTMEACATSQFEQQLRAVCNLPLGDARLVQPAAMGNLLGHLWEKQPPDFRPIFAEPRASLHLYGKLEAMVGRKMGHVTCVDASPELAVQRVRELRERIVEPR